MNEHFLPSAARWSARVLAALLLGLCVACGGGGGGGTTDGGGPPGPGNEQTKQILEDCLPSAVDDLLGTLGLVDAVVGGTGSSANVSIPPGGTDSTVMTGMLGWELDSDAMPPPEASGSIILSTMSGANPPLTQQDVDNLDMTGIDALGPIVAALPADSSVNMSWAYPLPVLLNGQIDISVDAGTIGSTVGMCTRDDETCNVSLAWDGISLSAIQGPHPTGVFNLLIVTGAHNVDGTLTCNGTATATLSVKLDGGTTEGWSFDLDTGAVTAP